MPIKLRITRVACGKLRDALGGDAIALPEREIARKISDAVADPAHHRFAVTDIDHPEDVTILHELSFTARELVAGVLRVRDVALNAIQRDGAIITLLSSASVRNSINSGGWIPCDMPDPNAPKKPGRLAPKIEQAPAPAPVPEPEPEPAPAPAPEPSAPAPEPEPAHTAPEQLPAPTITALPPLEPRRLEPMPPMDLSRAAAAAKESRAAISEHVRLAEDLVDAEFELARAARNLAAAKLAHDRAEKRRERAATAIAGAAQRAADLEAP
jgi:hypothetical protein